MKLKIVMVVMVLVVCMGYQGYAQNDTETIKLSVLYDDPIVEDPDTTQLTQKQIKRILKKGELLMCKVDTLIEQEEYYVKNMIIALPKDPVFEHAYIQSSIYYVGGEKKIHCDYFLMEERTDKYIEINKDIFIACNLKKLSKYLDRKIRKTDLKECEKGYIPLD